MFGYIRPVRDELKVREFEQFKACYCGMCHTLGREYGPVARMVLNYDFTFLAMLLWEDADAPAIEHRRCISSPCRKKACCCPNGAMTTAAGHSVILAYYKLVDSVRDSSFWRSLPYRVAVIVMHRAFKKAKRRYPEYAETVEALLSELDMLEAAGETSSDRAADKFSLILAASAPVHSADAIARPLQQMLYHTGRYIYMVDACDDLREDAEKGEYNPVAARFKLTDGKLTEEAEQQITRTLQHSQNIIGSSFELLPQTSWTGIIRNIIYLGMPGIISAVLAGKWRKPAGKAPK